jgi:hypothetical protein
MNERMDPLLPLLTAAFLCLLPGALIFQACPDLLREFRSLLEVRKGMWELSDRLEARR